MPDDHPSSKRPRRAQVANACLACRSAKLKCSGGHPVCARCLDRELDCIYDVSEGLTKRQQLRLDLHEQKDELDRAMSILRHLQKGTDQEATEMLARLRIGQSIESEYQRLQARSTGSSVGEAPSPSPVMPMDEDLNRENHRLLSLLTPQMQAFNVLASARGAVDAPSSSNDPIQSRVEEWMQDGIDSNGMSWMPQYHHQHYSGIIDPQTFESTTRHHPTSEQESSGAGGNFYTHPPGPHNGM